MLNAGFPWTLSFILFLMINWYTITEKGVCNYEKDRTLELVKCICAHAHVKISAALWILIVPGVFFLILVVNTYMYNMKMSHVHVHV